MHLHISKSVVWLKAVVNIQCTMLLASRGRQLLNMNVRLVTCCTYTLFLWHYKSQRPVTFCILIFIHGLVSNICCFAHEFLSYSTQTSEYSSSLVDQFNLVSNTCRKKETLSVRQMFNVSSLSVIIKLIDLTRLGLIYRQGHILRDFVLYKLC